MTTFLNRMTGAALLNPAIYEEVEADRSATIQAMAVVALSSLAAGVGALGLASARVTALAGISLLAFAVWVIWAVLTLQIGARIFPSSRTQADMGQLLRTIGFATAPGILRIGVLFQAPLLSCSPSRPSGCSWRWLSPSDRRSTIRARHAHSAYAHSGGRCRSASHWASACSARRCCTDRENGPAKAGHYVIVATVRLKPVTR